MFFEPGPALPRKIWPRNFLGQKSTKINKESLKIRLPGMSIFQGAKFRENKAKNT